MAPQDSQNCGRYFAKRKQSDAEFAGNSLLRMVIIDTVINTLLGGQTLDPAGMHCPSWDDAFVSSCIVLYCILWLAVSLWNYLTVMICKRQFCRLHFSFKLPSEQTGYRCKKFASSKCCACATFLIILIIIIITTTIFIFLTVNWSFSLSAVPGYLLSLRETFCDLLESPYSWDAYSNSVNIQQSSREIRFNPENVAE